MFRSDQSAHSFRDPRLEALAGASAMGRVVVTEFITLDGVVQAPGDPNQFNRGGWALGSAPARTLWRSSSRS
jgi:hypothetical protein